MDVPRKNFDSLPPQVRTAAEDLIRRVGRTRFWAAFKNLEACLARPGEGQPSPQDLFIALRLDAGANASPASVMLLNAARLELQGLNPPDALRFIGDGSEREAGLIAAISTRLGQPFLKANYLPHLSARHRYLYMAVPKVACTALKIALQQKELDAELDYFNHPGRAHDRRISPLLEPMDDSATFMQAIDASDWLRFTFVRNPFGRALSGYLNKIAYLSDERVQLGALQLDASSPPTFEEFLAAVLRQADSDRDIHWASQTFLTGIKKIDYGFIGRFESLERDLATLSDRLGFAERLVAPEVINRSGASLKLHQYFGARCADLVREIYADDFQNFDYSFQLPANGP